MSTGGALRVVVLASGSGTNLQVIIDQARSAALNIEIIAVISDKPNAYALTRAAQAGIATHSIDFSQCASRDAYDALLEQRLQELDPELIILAGYMRILNTTTVNAFLGRMLNVHPSLLPAYPGLDTYRRALDAGDAWHGTTVHFVTPELDSGPALVQYRVAIGPDDTEPSLQARVQQGEYLIYPQAIDWFASGRAEFKDNHAFLDGKRLDTPVVITEQ
jgi:phosphoribosylglycinamide formyltransferase-1